MKLEERLKWAREEFFDISKSLFSKSFLPYHLFLRIKNFKAQTPSMSEVRQVTTASSRAFEYAKQDQIKEAITTLCEIDGVGVPTASAILAMRFPKDYAIIDRRVIAELGMKDEFKDYLVSAETYEKYLRLMRERAQQANLSLRNYEKGLFETSMRRD